MSTSAINEDTWRFSMGTAERMEYQNKEQHEQVMEGFVKNEGVPIFIAATKGWIVILDEVIEKL
jgi:tRNA G18 (ribose-2'-O)-methylase SpoU